jgi:hypothetical protein
MRTQGDAALELWAARLGSDLFSAQFGLPVEFGVAESAVRRGSSG